MYKGNISTVNIYNKRNGSKMVRKILQMVIKNSGRNKIEKESLNALHSC